MAFFGLWGNDKAMARSDYSGRESASAKRDSKEAERSAKRRKDHRASIPTATRAERAWDSKDRRAWGDDHPFPRRR